VYYGLTTKSNQVYIGIVGCGLIADIHAEAIAAAQNCQLIAAYSRSQEKAEDFGKKYHIIGYTDWDEFISNPEMDAVSICTASGTHLDYGKIAADAGKHVIIEKPIEVNLQRAGELVTYCTGKKVSLAVIYQNRFYADILNAYEKLQEKCIGDIFLADVRIKWYRSQEYYDSAAWRGTIELDGGGVLINQAIHTIDLLYWFLGKVKKVTAHAMTRTHDGIEGEDNAVAILEFENGALATLNASTSVIPAQSRKIELHGTSGTMILDGDMVSWLQEGDVQTDARKVLPKGADSPLQNFPLEPHRDQFDAIARAIFKGKQPPVSGAESIQSLAIVQAVYESVRLQKTIFINSLF